MSTFDWFHHTVKALEISDIMKICLEIALKASDQ